VTVTGTATTVCGTLSHSITIPLTVNTPPPPDFSLSASPSSQTVTVGSRTSYTVSVGALNGFSGSVSLSNGSLPTGVTASFNPTSITGFRQFRAERFHVGLDSRGHLHADHHGNQRQPEPQRDRFVGGERREHLFYGDCQQHVERHGILLAQRKLYGNV